MSLSERFSKLKSQSIASGRVDRQISQNNSTKEKRNNQTQGKRGLKVNNALGLAKNANPRGGKRPTKVGQVTAKGLRSLLVMSRGLPPSAWGHSQ